MATPQHDHNHSECVHDALHTATELCAKRGARLTDIRRRVLELVWRSHEPVGAYALLDALKGDGFSAAPPTVYRALDFLMAQGLVHRIASLNAFIGCPHPRHPHDGQYLICEACGSVTEIAADGIGGAIDHAAAAEGFAVARRTVELFGRCARCQAAAA